VSLIRDVCGKCPCPESCSRAAVFCKWAKNGLDDVQRRHICNYKANSERTPQAYPSIAKQARNFFRDMMAFARSGGKLAPKALRVARLAVCESCEKWDKQQRRCRACGCKADAKVYSLVAKCPLDLWPKQERVAS
jgi:hypothetical protein